MLTLNLIRHAKTQQISPTGHDFGRELLDKGISQANILGNYLQAHHISLGKVICSSAVRAQQTRSIICQHLTERCNYELTKELYDASYNDIIRAVIAHGEQESVVTVVGHNDGISRLACYLSGEMISLRTSEMISLAVPFETWDHLSEGIAGIIFQYRPEVFLPHPVIS